jgi:MerR family redox-sensitive transcriptional activator SoxR
MENGLLSISEVGEATGLPSSALRYYERVGLIASKGRVGGRRQFRPDVLQRLAVIALLQEVGFTISEIGDLVRHRRGVNRWRALAEEKLEEIDAHLERVREAKELLTAALACECSRLADCELVSQRRGRHRRAVHKLSLRMGPPD